MEVNSAVCRSDCGAADDTTPFFGGAASTTISLSPGETIAFSVPATGLAEDDSFVAEVTITYSQNIGGQTVNKIEKGKLTGTVAA